jgi:hypothetical protein
MKQGLSADDRMVSIENLRITEMANQTSVFLCLFAESSVMGKRRFLQAMCEHEHCGLSW